MGQTTVGRRIWNPLPGPQTEAARCLADITGYGGAAGGGKTDLALGLAFTEHQRSIIYRREAVQLLGILERASDIVGDRKGYNGQDKIWRYDDGILKRTIEFGGVQLLQDRTKYQGRPHDLKVFDEVTEFLEQQVRFLMGWLRSDRPEVRQRILMTFNPPTSVEGQWVIDFFGPWLRKDHPNPAEPGELRYFTTVAGVDQECDGPEPVMVDGELVEPMSRTFIPARVEDNPYYMATGYKRVLQALPEPLRSQMLKGDFEAGLGDDAFQVLPTPWVEACQERWIQRQQRMETEARKPPMSSMGVDCARGGDDKTIISRRRGNWFDELLAYPGTATPDGPIAAGLVIGAMRDRAPVHVDGIGIGASVYDFLIDAGVHAVSVIGSKSTDELDFSGMLGFRNFRSMLYWKFREWIDPANENNVCLPPDRDLKIELCTPRFRVRSGKIQVESKEPDAEFSMWERLGRSPDKADAVIYASISTPKRAYDEEENDINDQDRSSVGGY